MVTFLGFRVQLCFGEGRALQTCITGVCGECPQSLGHTGFVPAHGMCAFPLYILQTLGCTAGNCFRLALGLHALPRSKPLRFRFLGTPQRRRFGWACILCPSQVRAAQVTMLGECSHPQLGAMSYHLPHPSSFFFFGVQLVHLLTCAMYLFWSADLWL